MTNVLSRASLLDGSSINPQQNFDLQYWSEKLGVTREELMEAIAKVGPVVGDVRRALGISNGDFLQEKSIR